MPAAVPTARVVVVSGVELDAARSLAAEGWAVVIVAGDAASTVTVGDAVAELEVAGARVAVFRGDLADPAARAALTELVDELFG